MIHYTVYNHIIHLPNQWDAFVKHDVFLQSSYLKGIQESSPNNLEWYYVGVFKGDNLVGVAIIQHVQLYLKDMFRQTKVSCVKTFLKDVLSKILKGNILVLGNLTHTGQHGLYINDNEISQSQFFESVFSAAKEISNTIWTQKRKRIRLIMLKDYFEDDVIHHCNIIKETEKFHKVSVQPNMLLSVRPNWLTMQDYISDLSKKYRDRYKRARNKFNGIQSVELSEDDIKNHSAALHALYMNVSNNAKFNTFILPENHFYSLKLHLKDKFKVFGYYLDNTLVGFYTLILNQPHLETYFLGYDETHQYPNQLYLNMLYDMLKFGIENQYKTIVYARTAMEIKSSVGAKAKPMVIYMKHTNSFLNIVLKLVFKLMNPSQDWEERHPFLEVRL